MSKILSNPFIFRSIQTVKPHVPLIRFRKGEPDKRQIASADNSHSGSGTGKKTGTVKLPVVEDHQLPARFWRAPIDDKEIEAINSGGAV
ncbi:unnamed protein product [Bemisia tabaci]|uniref:28S ribosomal protein S36, mitochondrial n=1 Tax=Bemisia tabaci TaxID=7038 RepID=A0A9P0AHB2_BEMTA|nr:PREDICTED: 37S ribosomal protein YMR-31, mitochondrial [Bemisia tabaci]CAH0391851.1 unnamed protein product [Bemisia tabaci]